MLCDPCLDAARDLVELMLGVPQGTAAARSLHTERVMQAYRALHRRHYAPRDVPEAKR